MLRRDAPLWLIPATFAVGLCLTLVPLPSSLTVWRPEWLLLLLVFWAMHQPSAVGIWTAFGIGFVLDLALHTRLGIHPAALVTAVWLARAAFLRIRRLDFPVTLVIAAALAGVFLLIRYGLLTLTGSRPLTADYWLPWFGSVLAWPLVVAALQRWGKH